MSKTRSTAAAPSSPTGWPWPDRNRDEGQRIRIGNRSQTAPRGRRGGHVEDEVDGCRTVQPHWLALARQEPRRGTANPHREQVANRSLRWPCRRRCRLLRHLSGRRADGYPTSSGTKDHETKRCRQQVGNGLSRDLADKTYAVLRWQAIAWCCLFIDVRVYCLQ